MKDCGASSQPYCSPGADEGKEGGEDRTPETKQLKVLVRAGSILI